MHVWRITLFSLAALLLAGCPSRPPAPAGLDEQQLTKAVLDYLDCDECVEGQYEYLISLGWQVQGLLVKAENLEPPFSAILADRKARYEEQAIDAVARRLGQPRTSADVESRAVELADLYIAGDERRYRTRAARAREHLRGGRIRRTEG